MTAMKEEPITPSAGPTLDAQGRLTYIGEDGQRYVVLDALELDHQTSLRVADALRDAGLLLDQIESLAQRWMDQVSAEALSRKDALDLLLATLETDLEDEAASADGVID